LGIRRAERGLARGRERNGTEAGKFNVCELSSRPAWKWDA
jgi:hypothetical protein